MKATKMIKTGVLAIAAGFALATSATTKTLGNGFTYVNGGDDEPQPGVWDSRYTKVINKAVAEGIPVAIFCALSSCGRCNNLEKEIVEMGADFTAWAKSRGYLLLFGMLGEGESGKTLALIQSGDALPQCGVWWDKDGDGKADVGDKKKTSWTGTDAKYVRNFLKNVDKYLGEYSPVPEYAGGTFDFEETENDRLECEAGQTSVSFTLVRGEKESEYDSEVWLTATWPDGDGFDRQTIQWEAGESNKEVTVDISGANFAKDGEQATIVLSSTNGIDQATNHITYVVKKNSFENPLWVTERSATRSAPALDFGEWTMDLDGAKALAASAKGDAYVLAAAVGSLWCGDCANTEKNFTGLEDGDGNNLFQKWARDNAVALVSIDIPNYKKDGYSGATLLSRTVGTNGKSGRGYLTRKGVSDEDAATMLERNRRLVSTDTAEGGFHRAEDTNLYRTGVPIFVVLRKDGSVAARFTRYAAKGALASDNWDDVIKRFDEMLAIAGKGKTSHADVSEIENNHASTTPLVVEANGGEVTGELSCADLFDVYRLGSFAGNATLSVMVTNESKAQVEISLWKSGDADKIVGTERIGRLCDGVSIEYTFAEAGEYYVRVAAYPYSLNLSKPPIVDLSDKFSHLNPDAMNFTQYTLTSEVAYYTPNGAKATAKAQDGSKTVKMQLEAEVLYRFVGLDGESAVNADALKPVEGVKDFYTAKQGGTVTLDAVAAGGTVEYQKWEPGAVGFEPDAETKTTEVTVSESKDVTVGYRRVNGVSGDVTVKIALNKEETDFYYDLYDVGVVDNKTLPRFKVDGELGFTEKEITWADGLPLEECVDSLLVQAADSEYGLISQYFGPGKVVFDITIVAQTEAGEATNVVDNGKFTINFTEDQKPEAGTVAILDAVNDAGEGWVKKQTIYARENGSATLTLGRLEASQGRIRAELTSSVKGVVFDGDYDIVGVPWENHDDKDKTVVVTNLPAAGKSVKLTLKASELSPELKVMKGSNVVTIVSVAADAPAFSEAAYSDTVYRYATVSNVYQVVCEDGDVLSFKKVSGSLPSGLKVSADSAGKAMVVSGVPTGNDKAGKTYYAIYQVTAKRGKKTVQGLTATIGFTVKDPAANGSGADGKALNDSCAKTKKPGSAMVFRVAEDGATAELVGMLTGLTLPATGKASAKFECADGKVSLSAKSWSDVNDEDPESKNYGMMGVTLVGKGGYALDVDVSRGGEVVATLAKGDTFYEDISFEGTDWSKDNPAKDCMGYYTVTLPVATNTDGPAIKENREGVASRAAAYLTLTMTSASDANKGLMKWAGMLPNGEKSSGSSTLVDAGDKANVYLPYWKFAKKDNFTGVVKIERGAAANSKDFHGDEVTCYETVSTPKIDFDDGEIPVRSVWRHSENSKATTDGDYEVAYEPYGGIYDASFGLDCCCIDGRGTADMTLTVSQLETPSDVYGVFDHIDQLPVKVGEKTMTLPAGGGKQKLTLKFNSKTGVVSGKFNLSYTDEKKRTKTVSASYNGVVQLGFGDSCGCNDNPEPFVSGFWFFTDKLSYPVTGGKSKTISVKRGASVTIDVE